MNLKRITPYVIIFLVSSVVLTYIFSTGAVAFGLGMGCVFALALVLQIRKDNRT